LLRNIFALLLLAVSALAQSAPQITVIHAGRLLDVKTGRVLTNQQIVIEGDKIVSVGPAAGVTSGAQVIELPNSTVLPGMIDAHTHLTYENTKLGYEGLGVSVPREALTGAKNARLTVMAGFTTVRNLGANAYADVALRDAINDGDIPGPRMIVSGPALGITGGHCDENLLPFEYNKSADGVADGISGVQHKVREVIKYGADVIKVCATGGVMSKGDDPNTSQYTL